MRAGAGTQDGMGCEDSISTGIGKTKEQDPWGGRGLMIERERKRYDSGEARTGETEP